jgi:hypothetical protein
MSNIELYYPETMATKKNDGDGKIYFDLNFNDDFGSIDVKDRNKNFTNNFATSIDKYTAYSFYINSADKFPYLSDPKYPKNHATHYLVIVQIKDGESNPTNCIAIPICNNYEGKWSKYAKDFKNTQVRSIDKLLENRASTLIDLNSTMNELKGGDDNYKKSESISINYPTATTTTTTTIYVINKFIYVEPSIKMSLYKQLITTKITYNSQNQGQQNYSIVYISATCGPNGNIKNASPLFDLGKDMDFSKFIIYNISLIISYLILLIVFCKFYFKYDTTKIKFCFFAILSIPIILFVILIKINQANKINNDDMKLLILSTFYSLGFISIASLMFLIPRLFNALQGNSIEFSMQPIIGFFYETYYDIKYRNYQKIFQPIFGLVILYVVILGGYELTKIPILKIK